MQSDLEFLVRCGVDDINSGMTGLASLRAWSRWFGVVITGGRLGGTDVLLDHMQMVISSVDRFSKMTCYSWQWQVWPSEVILMAYGTEKGGAGGITGAAMEKGELLRCPCNIICVGCACRRVDIVQAWPLLQRVMQWDHVQVSCQICCPVKTVWSFLVTMTLVIPKWTWHPCTYSFRTETSGRCTSSNL